MTKKKLIMIGLIMFLIGSLFMVGFMYFQSGKSFDGAALDIEESNLKLGDLELTFVDGAYFKGLDEFITDLELYDVYEDHILLNVKIKNNSEEPVGLDNISVINANNETVGEGIFVYIDEELPYALDKEVVTKNKLMLSGPDLYGEEEREGLLYIPTFKLKGETIFIEFSSYGNSDRVKVKLTKDDFNTENWSDIVVLKEELREDVNLGKLKEGFDLEFEERDLSLGDLDIKVTGSQYFHEVPDDFLESVSHLTSFNGLESLLLLDIEIKNNSDKDSHINLFNLYKGDEESSEGIFTSLEIVGSEGFGNGVVPRTFIKDYDLLEFRGVGENRVPLQGKESIKGKIIFIDDDLEENIKYFLEYEGLDGKSDKVDFIIK